LGFRFTFSADELDERNWVYDFGGCKWIKKFLDDNFDHKLAVAKDDPSPLQMLNENVADVIVMDGVGCEKFAEHIYNFVSPKIKEETNGRVNLKSVEVFEHGSNSAIYNGESE
jgi:6-pyruvoyltetrahydropterin/6-carboxytetrahydropterin synthase